MHIFPGACVIVSVTLLFATLSGCRTGAPRVVWNEGEDFVSAPAQGETEPEQYLPASGMDLLDRAALNAKDDVVTYVLDVPSDIPDAKLVLRYARPWLRHSPNTPIRLALVGPMDQGKNTPPPVRTYEEDLGNTNGWGGRTVDWKLRTVNVGELAKGKYTLLLTAQADHGSATIDGFFIAPSDFQIVEEELNPLVRIKITSDGYAGLRRPSIIVRQDAEKVLTLTARSFEPAVECALDKAFLTDADGKQMPLAVEPDPAAGKFKLDVASIADGDYVLTVQMLHPAAELSTPVIFAGQFIGSLDMAAIESASKSAGQAANAERCATDIEHILKYLGDNKAKILTGTETDETVWIPGLMEYANWIRFPYDLMRNSRKALHDSQETIRRLSAGEDPYEGRFGELRRGYRSATTDSVEAYRVFVPTSYATAEKVPLILYLHGSGDDENYFVDLNGGAILDGLQKAGYMAVMPKWYSDRLDDLPILLELIMKEYPKVDPTRIYCTGLSMGGFGTYRLGAAHPELFAAVASCAGTGSLELAPNFKNLPILILHGEADPVVSVEGARATAAKMKELGHVYEIHTFPGHGHGYKMPEYMDISFEFFGRYTRKY